MTMRNSNTGALEVYDIANNALAGAYSMGAVGLNWEGGGIAPDALNASTASMGASGAPTAWMPDGPGFVRISVTDHHHKSITADVWIE